MPAPDAIKNPSLSQDYFLPEKEGKSNVAAAPAESSEIAANTVDSAGLTSDTSAKGSTDAPAEESEKEISGDQDADDEYKLETAPIDFRFPTTNQTRHCFTRYIEYHRCVAAKGEDASECNKFAKYYRSLCPSEWVERWNEQRENGTFPGPL